MADDTAPARSSLRTMLARAEAGVLLLGITPPRRSVSPEQAAQIAEVTLARLATVDLDGLILYDIDDESDRNPQERPFPYLPTMDPVAFHRDHLGAWGLPAVIYRCVGKYTEPSWRTGSGRWTPTGCWACSSGPRRGTRVCAPG